jgi:L-lactate dehydrogenase complex protein LldG
MSGRDDILAKIRTGLGVKPANAARTAAVRARLDARDRHPTPARVAGRSREDHKRLLAGFLESCQATVIEVRAPAVATAILDYLRSQNLPARVRHGTDPFLAGLDWSGAPGLERRVGRAEPGDEVALSHALAGIAETGTLAIASGADNPVTLNFLPETHIVVVEEADIVGPYEDALQRVRDRFGAGRMPRTVNLISGPSRTGDIGGKIVMGAHGPRRMCVVIVKAAEAG